jgi:hypothetical protein
MTLITINPREHSPTINNDEIRLIGSAHCEEFMSQLSERHIVPKSFLAINHSE